MKLYGKKKTTNEWLKKNRYTFIVYMYIFSNNLLCFITLICTDGQQLNKKYDHNDFQVDVPDSIGVSKIYISMQRITLNFNKDKYNGQAMESSSSHY
jgi:hypothetical protein